MDTARRVLLVSYDVTDDARRGEVFSTLKGFGDPVQYSVFCCDLTPSERIRLVARLRGLINHAEDRVLVADLGPTHGRGSKAITTLGRGFDMPTRGPTIV